MRLRRSILAGAAFACALALATALLPAGAAHAETTQDGAPEAAQRTIPVAPVDPATGRGQIVLAIADWLEQRMGSGSDGVRLTLDAPMHAEERDGTVIVHLPGAHISDSSDLGLDHAMGDLAIAVTPRGGPVYDFEAALPRELVHPRERLTIGEGTIAGTWRSDLNTTTRLEVAAIDLRFFEGRPSLEVLSMTVGGISAADELVEGADGLWDGRSTWVITDMESEESSLDALEFSGTFQGAGRDLVLAMRWDFTLFPDQGSVAEVFPQGLSTLIGAPWGQSDFNLVLRGLTVVSHVSGQGKGRLTLGEVSWRTTFDDNGAHGDLATQLTIIDPRLSGALVSQFPPDYLPLMMSIDIALDRLPARRIVEAYAGLLEQESFDESDLAATGDVALDYMDAADTALELRDIHVAAPAYDLRAGGRLQAKPASVLGVIGRLDVRLRGLSNLMDLAAREGNEEGMAFLVFLKGLGTPVFEEGSDEPALAYEIDLRRGGAVTVNGIPLDALFQDDSPPQ